jgi:MFS family permease
VITACAVQNGEERSTALLQTKGFSTAYWIYLAAGAFITAGFADVALVAFHFRKAGTVMESAIPIFYAVAMAAGALASFILGWLFDRHGFLVLLIAFSLASLFAPFVFLGGFTLALIGMVLWGAGMGAQDSLLKAALARVIQANRRSTGFGVFDTGFGIAWFLGSAAMGLLYDVSIPALVVFSVALQLGALSALFIARQYVVQTEARR